MKNIAILACQKSNKVCAGCACLKAMNDRTHAFECYAGEELRLIAFMRCSNCVSEISPLEDPGFLEKLDRLVSEGTQILHIGKCSHRRDTGLCPGMKQMAEAFEARGIEVVWGTH